MRETRNHVIMKGNNIVFQWLPGYCSISSNDLTDEDNRKAHEGTNLASLPLSRTDTVKYLSKLAHDLTSQKRHAPALIHHRLHLLYPSMQLRLLPDIPRSEETVLCCLCLDVALSLMHTRCKLGDQ